MTALDQTPRTLFDPEFLGALEHLRMLARRVPAGGRAGEQRSRARGGGVEFTDVRAYVPGDDFRKIDWHLLQRLDKLFLRLYLQDEDLPVYFLLDQSRSMARESKPGRSRSRTARQAVAALAYVGLNHMDRVYAFPFADSEMQPLPGLAGKAAFHRMLAFLAALPASGGTGLVEALARFAQRRLRRGLCVVVSDFFDPRGLEPVLPVLQQIRHQLLFLRPVQPGEDRPDLRGELQLVDCESGETLPVGVDDGLLDRHQQAYRQFEATLDATATRLGAGIARLRTDLPTVPQLTSLFPHGVLHA
jgi:uncharacterized protein (DUF58 family)